MLNVFVFGGRAQREGQSNGSLELTEVLLEELDKAGYSPLQARVTFIPAYSDIEDVARRLHLQRLRYKLSREQFGIIVCAFSHGAGFGLRRLAGYHPWWGKLGFSTGLPRFGLNVNAAVTSDGIYYSWLGLKTAQIYGILGHYKIYYPPAVLKLDSFRQETSLPLGMTPVLAQGRKLLSDEVLTYEHVEMDDAPEYHAKCKEVVLAAAIKYIPSQQKGKIPEPMDKAPAIAPSELLESKLEIVEAKKNE